MVYIPSLLAGETTTPIVSPCVGICTLNAQKECIGCGRLLEEIAQWLSYSNAERESVMLRLKALAEWKEPAKDELSEVPTWEEKHERIHCPRCGERFACKVNSPTRCDCTDIRLTPDEMEYILPLADGECLCPNCLDQLRTEYRLLHGF
jgi:predicted Fe-S protein YdhL (DUF1289 family)